MRLLILLLISCITSSLSLNAQKVHTIDFNISNYENDTLIIGYYIMDKQLVHDTVYASEKGKFTLTDTLQEGVYLALTLPDNKFLQFIVNNKEDNFSMSFDYENKTKLSFENSADNANFQSYVDFVAEKRPISDQLRDTISKIRETGADLTEFTEALNNVNLEVKAKQKQIIEEHPDLISTMLIKANMEIEMPEFGTSEEQRMLQYRYYKKHYFDYIDLGNPISLRTPFLFSRIDYYINKLTMNHPDSISESIDSILTWVKPSEESFKYYLSHFLNSYASTKVVGYDAVYVHIADNYYAKGLAPWVQEENMAKIMSKANLTRPVLLGKIGQDIMVYQEDGTAISISDIDYEYLVLLFWAPDCPHCKKTMPQFVEFNERYKDQGIKTFAICTKYKEKTKDCWEMVKEKDMLGFYNGADEFNRSGFKVKYNVTSTPKVYILNKEREILMKNIGPEQLDAVFEQIFEMEEKKNKAIE